MDYADVDCAKDLDGQRSINGYVFTIVDDCISWRSILQKCLSKYITNIEYAVVVDVAKNIILLNMLIIEMGLNQKNINLHCDN